MCVPRDSQLTPAALAKRAPVPVPADSSVPPISCRTTFPDQGSAGALVLAACMESRSTVAASEVKAGLGTARLAAARIPLRSPPCTTGMTMGLSWGRA